MAVNYGVDEWADARNLRIRRTPHPSCVLCNGTGLTRRKDLHETRPCDCAEAQAIEADLKTWASVFQPSRRYEKERRP